jgi:hypothetical protein
VRSLWPEQFCWRERPYEFVADKPAIDLLTGSDRVRLGIDRGDTLAEIEATWVEGERELATSRESWFLYQ